MYHPREKNRIKLCTPVEDARGLNVDTFFNSESDDQDDYGGYHVINAKRHIKAKKMQIDSDFSVNALYRERTKLFEESLNKSQSTSDEEYLDLSSLNSNERKTKEIEESDSRNTEQCCRFHTHTPKKTDHDISNEFSDCLSLTSESMNLYQKINGNIKAEMTSPKIQIIHERRNVKNGNKVEEEDLNEQKNLDLKSLTEKFGSGIEELPPKASWTIHCTNVEPEFLNKFVQMLHDMQKDETQSVEINMISTTNLNELLNQNSITSPIQTTCQDSKTEPKIDLVNERKIESPKKQSNLTAEQNVAKKPSKSRKKVATAESNDVKNLIGKYPCNVVPPNCNIKESIQDSRLKFKDSLFFAPYDPTVKKIESRQNEACCSSLREETDNQKIKRTNYGNKKNYNIYVQSGWSFLQSSKKPTVNVLRSNHPTSVSLSREQTRSPDIFDDLTLDDLLPFQSEYPRRDDQSRMTSDVKKRDKPLRPKTVTFGCSPKKTPRMKKPEKNARLAITPRETMTADAATKYRNRILNNIKEGRGKVVSQPSKIINETRRKTVAFKPITRDSPDKTEDNIHLRMISPDKKSTVRKLFPYINNHDNKVFQNFTVLPIKVSYNCLPTIKKNSPSKESDGTSDDSHLQYKKRNGNTNLSTKASKNFTCIIPSKPVLQKPGTPNSARTSRYVTPRNSKEIQQQKVSPKYSPRSRTSTEANPSIPNCAKLIYKMCAKNLGSNSKIYSTPRTDKLEVDTQISNDSNNLDVKDSKHGSTGVKNHEVNPAYELVNYIYTFEGQKFVNNIQNTTCAGKDGSQINNNKFCKSNTNQDNTKNKRVCSENKVALQPAYDDQIKSLLKQIMEETRSAKSTMKSAAKIRQHPIKNSTSEKDQRKDSKKHNNNKKILESGQWKKIVGNAENIKRLAKSTHSAKPSGMLNLPISGNENVSTLLDAISEEQETKVDDSFEKTHDSRTFESGERLPGEDLSNSSRNSSIVEFSTNMELIETANPAQYPISFPNEKILTSNINAFQCLKMMKEKQTSLNNKNENLQEGNYPAENENKSGFTILYSSNYSETSSPIQSSVDMDLLTSQKLKFNTRRVFRGMSKEAFGKFAEIVKTKTNLIINLTEGMDMDDQLCSKTVISTRSTGESSISINLRSASVSSVENIETLTKEPISGSSAMLKTQTPLSSEYYLGSSISSNSELDPRRGIRLKTSQYSLSGKISNFATIPIPMAPKNTCTLSHNHEQSVSLKEIIPNLPRVVTFLAALLKREQEETANEEVGNYSQTVTKKLKQRVSPSTSTNMLSLQHSMLLPTNSQESEINDIIPEEPQQINTLREGNSSHIRYETDETTKVKGTLTEIFHLFKLLPHLKVKKKSTNKSKSAKLDVSKTIIMSVPDTKRRIEDRKRKNLRMEKRHLQKMIEKKDERDAVILNIFYVAFFVLAYTCLTLCNYSCDFTGGNI